MSKSIFLSHAEPNRELAEKLVTLIETGIGIQSEEIFCSSLESMGIPIGSNFVEFIREQVEEPKVVILLLSEDYFQSQFCLCEMGASWVLGHRVLPLLVPPQGFDDVKVVLTGIQAAKIDDLDGLNQMREDLVEIFNIDGKVFARWEVMRNNFVNEINQMNLSGVPRSTFSAEEHEILQTKYDDAVHEIEENLMEILRKDEIIEQLKQTKDADEVNDIIASSLDDLPLFEKLVKESKTSLRPLPSIVQKTLYYHFQNECFPWPTSFDDDIKEELNHAIEEDFLEEQEDGCTVVMEDPKIGVAIDAIGKLQKFINGIDDDTEFYEYYASTYEHRLKFNSKRFWEEHLY